MSVTELAAWWGGAVATLVLAWDIYKWKKSGPIINVSASPNMQTLGCVADGLEGKTFIVVEVTNTGDRKTTLTQCALTEQERQIFYHRQSRLIDPAVACSRARRTWLGGIDQNDDIERMSRAGYLYCGIYHSSSKRPMFTRVVVPRDTSG